VDLLPVAAEVTMFDEVVVCYKFIGDLMFYVTGSQDENELILHTVLVAFYESVTLLLRCEAVSNFMFFVNACCSMLQICFSPSVHLAYAMQECCREKNCSRKS